MKLDEEEIGYDVLWYTIHEQSERLKLCLESIQFIKFNA